MISFSLKTRHNLHIKEKALPAYTIHCWSSPAIILKETALSYKISEVLLKIKTKKWLKVENIPQETT